MKQDPLNDPTSNSCHKNKKVALWNNFLRREIHLCREVKKGKDKKRVEVWEVMGIKMVLTKGANQWFYLFIFFFLNFI